jgi:micrococcal nuclease
MMVRMDTFLVLAGLTGMLIAVVNLIRPRGGFGLVNRRRAGSLLGAAFLTILIGASITPVQGDISPIDDATTTTLEATTPVPSSAAGTTTTAGVSTTAAPGGPAFLLPPGPGPSGDPDQPGPSGAQLASVLAITDGDTLTVTFAGGGTDTVRLIGINTPEFGECFYDEATAVLTALASPGDQVTMTADVSDRDQFDRLLRYLWVGQMSVNEELVRRGAAIARRYPPDTALSDRLEAAQSSAQSAQVGLWAPEVCGPSSESGLRILEVFYDAPGDDNTNLNEEWVTIRNDGASSVDLGGWALKDESATHRFSFPIPFRLAAGEVVTIRTGCGEDLGTELFWCNQGSAVWNNTGDTAFLLDPNGNVHDTFGYLP